MDKKTKNGWAFYDWANSVYSLVISTAIFPIYFHSVTSTDDSSMVDFLGISYENMAIYSYSLSFSFFIVALISPVLSGIADYTGKKKRFLQFFCYLGSVSCASLFFFDGSNIYFGLGMSVLASIGFWGSLVFYNAFLPEIAPPEEQDALSAKGFSMGYIGAALLLILNLVMVMKPELFGFSDSGQASRVSFLLVGIWWAGFAQITFRRLPDNPHQRKPKDQYILLGYRELGKVIDQLKGEMALRRFLYSFFFYSMGVQTVILLASAFGDQELGMDSSKLILTILIIQFVAIAGSYLFAFISRKYGNIQAIKICIIVWIFVCLGAFTLSKSDPTAEYKFYAIAAIVGMVLGGIQAISRSTYSKLLPETKSHASFFSFYDVSEKVAIVLGTLAYGWLIQATGSMKMSVLALMVFFIIGYFLLLRVGKSRHVH
ncbi:MFS transporter [Owenweeksia hongkongensis]|uniref:MFS transporter n=1 Tax=Owenweeksia hongkongensis TaxID=253245 RepID=UPI003A9440F7